ncbi:hypothetical protein CDD81_2228 [Ophiocordyceps australis]|uniref:Uncharacterized protein n=1 Tax=Ophiocordyceps australis TaxID=1399860 RepID=A0A2C5XZ65_9HYPO|nr:hypothetical protein CDD81_2228 [Ophiocordyceps australis]
MVLFGPGQRFIYAFVLNADDEIINGDSGSWVIDEISWKVYGYVVASDAFGDTYVIPMTEALQDIQDTLGFISLELAAVEDVWDMALPHLTASPRKKVPISSRTEHHSHDLSNF